jgi:hypothetical protein
MREYSALMPFVGGCRETAPASFALLAEGYDPGRWKDSVFLDGFFGGGAIALTAKRAGFRVIANDLAERSAIAARAILANRPPRQTPEQIAGALIAPLDAPPLPLEHVGAWLHPFVADVIGVALERTRHGGDPFSRYLALLLVLQAKPGMYWTRLTETTRERQLEKFGRTVEEVQRKLVNRAKAVIRGIFDNGHEHEVHCTDAIALLRERGHEAVVCSLDPPTYGNDVYERNYFLVDSLLSGRAWREPVEPPKAHNWTKPEAEAFYRELCRAAEAVPFWLIRDDAILFAKGELAERMRDEWGRHVLHREAVRSGGHTSQLILAAAEPIRPTGKTFVVVPERRPAKPPLTKAEAIRRHFAYLSKWELPALAYCRQPDWDAIRPRLVRVRGAELLGVWNYYRYLVSSEPQKPAITGVGRWAPWMVIDEVSGALLGIFALTDDNASMAVRDAHIGWSQEQAEREIHRVVFLARCLPLQPFGQLLGGKLLAGLAASIEVVRDWELTYSYTAMALSIRTLHGESSQYNGLPGFVFLGTDDQGRGHYLVELRKKGLRALRGEVAPEATRNVKRSAEAWIEEWRTRWYMPRLARVRAGEVPVGLAVDASLYTLARWRI